VTSALPRRLVLAGTASLLVPLTVAPLRSQTAEAAVDYEITDWILIAPSGEITLGLSQPEVGQGSYTVLPQILAGRRVDNRALAELGHGGLLSRDMAYRFPPYRTNAARGELE